MKNRFFVVGCWLLVFSFGLGASANQVKEVEASGVKAWVIEDNFLPIISIQVAFKNAGYASDPASKQGLAYFTSGMLNEGAGEYSSQEFQKELEENAIEFAPDIDQDNFYISVKTLSQNLDKALDLTSSALTKARFGGEEVERVRGQILNIITKSEEDPSEVAVRKFSKVMFANHPYSNSEQGELASVKSISSADLKGFSNKAFAKDNIVISIVGDVSESQAKNIIDSITKDLPEKTSFKAAPKYENYPDAKTAEVKIKNPQTYVLFGFKGVERDSKDYYAAFILNHILGGDGFQSRLVENVREKNGLAYSVGTIIKPMKSATLLYGVVSTKNESVDKSIEIIKSQMKDVAENGVTEKEFEDAKAYITGSFGLNMDKNEKLAAYLSSMQIQGLGRDFLEKRNDYINSVTFADVNKVSKWLFKPDSMVVVRAGL